MIDFITFSLTLPYPTLHTVALYLIIGGLMTAGILSYLLVIAGDTRPIISKTSELIIGVSILMFGWPYVLYLFVKESWK